VKGVSPHTIASYRDSIVLLLRFAANQHGRSVSVMEFKHIDAQQILAFLNYLEINTTVGALPFHDSLSISVSAHLGTSFGKLGSRLVSEA